MLKYTSNGRRWLGRPLKRLLNEAETGLSRPNSRWILFLLLLLLVLVLLFLWCWSCCCLLSQAFSSGTSLEPKVIHTDQASSFRIQYFRYYVWCSKYSESIEYFPGLASKFFFKPTVTLPVASVITGIILHFIFHIHCISIYSPASFCTTFLSAVIAASVSMSSIFF